MALTRIRLDVHLVGGPRDGQRLTVPLEVEGLPSLAETGAGAVTCRAEEVGFRDPSGILHVYRNRDETDGRGFVLYDYLGPTSEEHR